MKSLSTEEGRGERMENSRSQERKKEDLQVETSEDETGPPCQREVLT